MLTNGCFTGRFECCCETDCATFHLTRKTLREDYALMCPKLDSTLITFFNCAHLFVSWCLNFYLYLIYLSVSGFSHSHDSVYFANAWVTQNKIKMEFSLTQRVISVGVCQFVRKCLKTLSEWLHVTTCHLEQSEKSIEIDQFDSNLLTFRESLSCTKYDHWRSPVKGSIHSIQKPKITNNKANKH